MLALLRSLADNLPSVDWIAALDNPPCAAYTKRAMHHIERSPWVELSIRLAVLWLINVIGLWLAGLVLPGVTVTQWGAAFLFMGVIGVFNTLLWPLITRLTLRFFVFTLGFFTILLNGLMFWAASFFVTGVVFGNFGSAVLSALLVGVFNTLVASLLAIDDDAAFYRSTVERAIRHMRGTAPVKPYPGVLFLEIDGCSETIFRRALAQGIMPTMAQWEQEGSHRIVGWETDLSCQTGSAQAGILHGNNRDIPAFRWVEKENNNRVVSANGPKDSPLIERRIDDGHGLLAVAGAARANLFSGNAADDLMVYSTLTSLSRFYRPSYYVFFVNPYNFLRTLTLCVAEVFKELWECRRQVRQNVQPRLPEQRSGLYPWVRAAATIFLRDMSVYTVIDDVLQGKADAIYATFYAYDEVAHHSGIDDSDSFSVLHQLDKAFARIERAAGDAGRRYEIVVLSDHGQSKGATFKQRYNITLKDLVESLLPAAVKTHHELDTHEGWGHVGALVTEAAQTQDRAVSKAVRRVTRRRTLAGEVLVGPEYRIQREERAGKRVAAEEAELIVLASGNLGLIYFTAWTERMSLEQINTAFPHLLAGLVAHPGIGFVMVRSEHLGPLAIGAQGVYHLHSGRIEGENPLRAYGPRLPAHLCRTDSFAHVPDVLVNSFYDPLKDEGCAFEELIGFHGGAGGDQSHPFLFVPTLWPVDAAEPIVGAEDVYRLFKQQLASLRGSSTSHAA
jgi:putative membrane protein